MKAVHKALIVLIAICLFAFAACDRGGGSGGSGQSGEKSLADQIEELEKSGKLPKLDRTDTIAGIDDNDNGIRDDIETYIEKTYTNEKQKKAVTQYARASQIELLVDVTNTEALEHAMKYGGDALVCVTRTFRADPNAENPYVTLDKIRAMTLNTKTRIRAYFAFDKAVNGFAWSYPQEDTCE